MSVMFGAMTSIRPEPSSGKQTISRSRATGAGTLPPVVVEQAICEPTVAIVAGVAVDQVGWTYRVIQPRHHGVHVPALSRCGDRLGQVPESKGLAHRGPVVLAEEEPPAHFKMAGRPLRVRERLPDRKRVHRANQRVVARGLARDAPEPILAALVDEAIAHGTLDEVPGVGRPVVERAADIGTRALADGHRPAVAVVGSHHRPGAHVGALSMGSLRAGRGQVEDHGLRAGHDVLRDDLRRGVRVKNVRVRRAKKPAPAPRVGQRVAPGRRAEDRPVVRDGAGRLVQRKQRDVAVVLEADEESERPAVRRAR